MRRFKLSKDATAGLTGLALAIVVFGGSWLAERAMNAKLQAQMERADAARVWAAHEYERSRHEQ